MSTLAKARLALGSLSRPVLLAVSVLGNGAVLAATSQWSQKYPPAIVFVSVLLLCAGATAVAVAAVRAADSTVRRILLELMMLAACLVVVEAGVVLWRPDPENASAIRRETAAKLGVPFDSRTNAQVVEEMRSEGIDALPGIGRTWAQLPMVRANLPKGFYPLTHASNASIVECNESGSHLIYRTDAFGLNNPPGLIASGAIDIAVVGESFALGHCLDPRKSLVGILRDAHPRTATFGLAGTRTLAELATFREYVEPLQPHLVLWFVHPWFIESRDDSRDPRLVRYLNSNFSQHLIRRQDEVDAAVRRLALPAQIEVEREGRAQSRQVEWTRLKEVWQLRAIRQQVLPQLRKALGLEDASTQSGPHLSLFLQSLHLAKQATDRWGGNFIVVLLPSYEEVVAHEIKGDARHDRLAQILRAHGIRVIDGVEPFIEQRDPAHLYNMRINNHPTAEGYSLLAGWVLEHIQHQPPSRLAVKH